MVRFIMRDDPEQAVLADTVMASLTSREPGYLSLVVLVELWRVLGRSYRRSVAQRRDVFAELLRTDELVLADSDLVEQALARVAEGADFADALIAAAARDAGCARTVTFDRQASQRAGMVWLSGQ